MKSLPRSAKKPSRLSDSLYRQLNAYALVAGAAGVGMLAQRAEAKIIYTKTDTGIGDSTILYVDNGRRGQFHFATHHGAGTTSGGSFRMSVFPIGKKNRIWGTSQAGASALRPGFRIGPNGKHFAYGNDFMVFYAWGGFGSVSEGPWRDTTNRYLGLQFVINGTTHYGWARLSVDFYINIQTLTGYAYETIPNKAIIAGKTKGPDVITVAPGSLGRLALGRK